MKRDSALEGQILSLVHHFEIREQSDLQKLLSEKGYDIPQATLSRRLKKLKVAKVAGIYKILDFGTPALPIILNIQASDFGMVVLHTHPGNANNLALYLDQKYVTFHPQQPKNSGILGTIAGDDTVLVIVKDKAATKQVLALLHQEFPYLT
jgi:transcriptional regulator of arginine metabolism